MTEMAVRLRWGIKTDEEWLTVPRDDRAWLAATVVAEGMMSAWDAQPDKVKAMYG